MSLGSGCEMSQAGPMYLGGGVLVAFHTVERVLCSINRKLWRVVATIQRDTQLGFINRGYIPVPEGVLVLTKSLGPYSRLAGQARRQPPR